MRAAFSGVYMIGCRHRRRSVTALESKRSGGLFSKQHFTAQVRIWSDMLMPMIMIMLYLYIACWDTLIHPRRSYIGCSDAGSLSWAVEKMALAIKSHFMWNFMIQYPTVISTECGVKKDETISLTVNYIIATLQQYGRKSCHCWSASTWAATI